MDGGREKLPERIRSLVVECWDGDPNARPSLAEICARLGKFGSSVGGYTGFVPPRRKTLARRLLNVGMSFYDPRQRSAKLIKLRGGREARQMSISKELMETGTVQHVYEAYESERQEKLERSRQGHRARFQERKKRRERRRREKGDETRGGERTAK